MRKVLMLAAVLTATASTLSAAAASLASLEAER
jgi:hypothetical protein